MLNLVCRELRNWFEKEKVFDKKIQIKDNEIVYPYITLQQNQYFRIVGSTFNDGVYKYPATGLINEEFEGAVWILAIPKEVVVLANDIEAFQAKYGDVSPYQSESFGGYSYSKSSAQSDWKSAFASRLNQWRKI